MHNSIEIFDPKTNEVDEFSLDFSRENFKIIIQKKEVSFGSLRILVEESHLGIHKIYPIMEESMPSLSISKTNLKNCENFFASKKLIITGSDFHRNIMKSLLALKTKSTSVERFTQSYKDFTLSCGLKSSYVRAVARSIASNEHFLTIPCHRILAHNGAMQGYRWGISLKKLLIEYRI